MLFNNTSSKRLFSNWFLLLIFLIESLTHDVLISTMVESTRMKDLAMDMKQMLDAMERRDQEYSSRGEQIESTLEVLTAE